MSSEDIKPGYKRTEVGVIPESWSVRSLGELCDYQNGTALEAYFNRRDGFKVISIGNYGVNGQFVETGNYIAFENRNLIEKFVLQNKDLAMSLNDKTAVGAIIGRVLLIEADDSYVFNQRTMRLRPKLFVSSSYLHHAINSNHIHASIVGLAKPGTQIYVNTDDVLNLRISIPDMDEQRAIATALSDVDALLAKLDQLIAKKRDLKQATMQQLLTGQTRLPGFSGAWQVKRLGDICTLEMGRTPSRANQSYWGQGYKWLSIADLKEKVILVSNEEVTELAAKEMKIIPKGTLLMSFKLSIGRLAFAGCDLFTNEAICSFNNLEANPNYLYYALSRIDFSLYGKQAVKGYTLNKASLKTVELSLPSPDEQTAIATVLSDMDAELATLQARRDKTHAIKQGMMQELLTGKIRLVSDEGSGEK